MKYFFHLLKQIIIGNLIKDKSFDFAVRIVRLNKYLQDEHKEYVLSKQILRSGTSIGANIREAYNGQSDADFIHKMSISQKECSETLYWLELLNACEYFESKLFSSIYDDCNEVYKILTSIILTKKENSRKVKN